ncbi:6-hydroxymethylpterin diphosphokinase MptE-like protein [Aliarcobacter lanthieri]|uniref:6-hydroxymethylpterin diphosphokinase MptE-like protein n=1 Tax=Aliarcobacter lanthieri TaxID=1355374 RepID=UPI003AAF7BB2
MDKAKQIEELQKTLNIIYLNNINFLKIHHSQLYKKIIDFEKSNKEKYSLEFIDDEFKLIDLQKNQNLYNIEPFSNSLNRINSFEFSNAFTLIKLENIEKRNYYENELNSSLYLNEYIQNFGNINIEINKFIFIGTLLGVHINDFHKHFNAKVYLIIEPNLEIFRLSLFLCDYESISKESKLFFAIDENKLNIKKLTNEFLEYKFELNNLIHFELINEDYKSILNDLNSYLTENSQMRYPFSEFIISLKRGYKYFFEEERNIINLSKKYNFLENKKILFLGAGVSLAKNLEWIYLNQEKFIIVASSAVLKHLRILNIIPDIILVIDGQKDVMLEQFNTDELMYKNSIVLASIKLDYELFSTKLKDTNIYFLQNALELFSGFGFLSGVTVGDLGVDILAKLGSSEIYLLGIDASIDSKNGKTHIGTHKSSRKVNLNVENCGDFKTDIIYVKGNLQAQVPTFREYIDMIDSLEEIISIHPKTKIYNLCSGAYFKGSFPLKLDHLNFENISKELFKIEFLNNLNNISKSNLDSIDKNEINKEQEVLKKLNDLDKNTFYKEFKVIFENYPQSMICNIFNRFFKLVLPYHNILKNQDIANKILEKQIDEVLNAFNTIFDKIDINFIRGN